MLRMQPGAIEGKDVSCILQQGGGGTNRGKKNEVGCHHNYSIEIFCDSTRNWIMESYELDGRSSAFSNSIGFEDMQLNLGSYHQEVMASGSSRIWFGWRQLHILLALCLTACIEYRTSCGYCAC